MPSLTPTIVQLVLINETGDSYYRMRFPGAELALQRPSWRIINLDAAAAERFEWAREADLLVLYQCADLDLIPLLRERIHAGKKTLVEYNDNFYEFPEWGPVAKQWSSPLLWQSYETFMHEADGVIVTGPGLADLFGANVPKEKLHILKNHLPNEPEPLNVLRPAPEAEVSIGWGGSLGHMADFLAIVPTIEEVLRAKPNAHLRVMGNSSIPSFLHIPSEQLHFTEWGTLKQYYEFWRPVQIGIAPLLDTAYNRCRSDIKAVEMAGMGVLPLLPDALPYREFLEKTGLTPFHNAAELRQILIHYIENPAALRNDLERAHAYVREERLGPRRTERAQLYEALLPQNLSAYAWPVACGYHEVKGTPPSTSPTKELLNKAQQLINQKKLSEARALLENKIAEFPANPDVLLALLKCLLAEGSSDYNTRLDLALSQFPKDLRFSLFKLNSTRSALLRSDLWHEVLRKVEDLPVSAREFYVHDLQRALANQLRIDPSASSIAESLVALFPLNAGLRLIHAEALVQQGRDSEALPHFLWLERTHDKITQNKEFPEQVKHGYLKAWIETLQARIKGAC